MPDVWKTLYRLVEFILSSYDALQGSFPYWKYCVFSGVQFKNRLYNLIQEVNQSIKSNIFQSKVF